MFERLNEAKSLATGRIKITDTAISAAVPEFLDDHLVTVVLAFIVQSLGLALFVGASVLRPKATLDTGMPSIMYVIAWMVSCGCAVLLVGFGAGRRSGAAIDSELAEQSPAAGGRR